MESRNFHTALFGGFRKRDVVNYLAEAKRRQEEELDRLRRQVEQLEQELADARAREDEGRDRTRQLEEQTQRAGQDREEARQAQSEAERRLEESQEDRRRLARQLLELQMEPPDPPEEAQSALPVEPPAEDRLWGLCGKMERTLAQMERLLDGPYRVTCYPDPPRRREEDLTAGSAPAQPPDPPQTQRSAVGAMLQRVRPKQGSQQ